MRPPAVGLGKWFASRRGSIIRTNSQEIGGHWSFRFPVRVHEILRLEKFDAGIREAHENPAVVTRPAVDGLARRLPVVSERSLAGQRLFARDPGFLKNHRAGMMRHLLEADGAAGMLPGPDVRIHGHGK